MPRVSLRKPQHTHTHTWIPFLLVLFVLFFGVTRKRSSGDVWAEGAKAEKIRTKTNGTQRGSWVSTLWLDSHFFFFWPRNDFFHFSRRYTHTRCVALLLFSMGVSQFAPSHPFSFNHFPPPSGPNNKSTQDMAQRHFREHLEKNFVFVYVNSERREEIPIL